ncbi:hypothetical protein OS125_11255 [Corynebacterium sp. P7003]|uniref:Uncharacterized protein n=1 Tax=Corynebacterium pygosceleis TaxID=2800406 RepID=A0ABT3WWW9_9CORY|nr:hypothetical protein [Corynebacterium pygosceleis]MCX7445809.1 hypothetical protein [Corynebacterium pygosceleis]
MTVCRPMRVIIIVGVLTLLLRGADYLTGDATQIGLFRVDGDLPPLVWGLACVIAAVIVSVGMLVKRLEVAAFGALLASATYTMFAVQSADQALFTPPVDDWRFAADYAARAVTWGVITGWLYMRAGVMEARRKKAGEGAARE